MGKLIDRATLATPQISNKIIMAIKFKHYDRFSQPIAISQPAILKASLCEELNEYEDIEYTISMYADLLTNENVALIKITKYPWYTSLQTLEEELISIIEEDYCDVTVEWL